MTLNIKFKLKYVKRTVSNLSFFVVIHKVFVLVDSNNSTSVTIQNETHIQVNFFLTITNTITSQIFPLPPELPCAPK